MNDVLPNVTTQNAYDAARTLYAPGSKRAELQISNALVWVQFGSVSGFPCGVDSVVWESPEIPMKPGFPILNRRFDAVRVRSYLAGTPAQVTILAVK